MADVNLRIGSLDKFVDREFRARARRALQIYRRVPLERDSPGYPFAQRQGDGSIRSPRSSRIDSIPNGVRITVQSRGAPFLEEGNDAGGAYITGNLFIPLKKTGPKRFARGGRAGKRRSSVVLVGGKPYLRTSRVKTYRGRRQLQRSAAIAFTGRSSF